MGGIAGSSPAWGACHSGYIFLKAKLLIVINCGSTSNLEQRMQQHNDPTYTLTKTTKRFQGPWELIWTEEHSSRREALIREKQIKKRGIARFLDGVILFGC